ncbi:MAG: hypothetical protein K0R90_230 [Oscillospiraceae bacterium]|jgi:uncharacterized membrane protein|nr:hypothetical protein [Oscillospiraceae bacterium]
MSLRKEIKISAKKFLKGNGGELIAVWIILAAVFIGFHLLEYFLFQLTGIKTFLDINRTPNDFLDDIINTSPQMLAITWGVQVAWFLIMSPFFVGIIKFFYDIIQGDQAKVCTIFKFFSPKLFLKTIYFKINIFIRLFFWAIAINVPAILSFMAVRFAFDSNGGYFDATILFLTLLMLGLILVCGLILFYVSLRYFLADYLFIEDPGQKIHKIIKTSVVAMKQNKAEIFKLCFSFVIWYLLCLLVLPVIFVASYVLSSASIYAKKYIDDAKMQEQIEKTQIIDKNI